MGAKLLQLDSGETVCFHCHTPVFTDKGFVPCGCVRAAWNGASFAIKASADDDSKTLKAKSPGQKNAIAAAEKFLRMWPEMRGLYLYGPEASGKTHIANYLFTRVIQTKPINGACWYMPDVIAECRSEAINKAGDGALQMYFSDAYSVKLLLLDDFAAERATEFAAEIVNGIINRRDRSELPLIITSNVDPMRLADFVDKRIASRILGMCEPVAVIGQDLRKGKVAA